MNQRSRLVAASLLVSLTAGAAAQADGIRPDQAAFRDIYKELVETNTTLSAGSCTEAAEKMAARLRAAGYPDSDLHLFVGARSSEGRRARRDSTRHRSPRRSAILLLAHIDVVEAKREDWERDPFKLVEENGYFYARGSLDDKSMAATWVDTLIRFARRGYKPRRTIKMALTCGEETSGAFNGAEYLAQETARPDRRRVRAQRRRAAACSTRRASASCTGVQAGEKISQNFRLEVTNPGGHSSRPVHEQRDLPPGRRARRGSSSYEFPVKLNDTTRAYFTRMAAHRRRRDGRGDDEAGGGPERRSRRSPMVDRRSDLQRACCARPAWRRCSTAATPPTRCRSERGANVNCRIFPGESARERRQDAGRSRRRSGSESVDAGDARTAVGRSPPLTREIMGPIEKVSARFYPGVPVIPLLQPGATDGQFLSTSGIPTYGVNGLFMDPDLGFIHGLNERMRVQSLYDGRDFLYELVKIYAAQR